MYRRLLKFIIFSLLFSPVCALAGSLGERVQEHQLENGMTVLLVERHNSPTVAAYINFRVGAVNENSEQRGIAHMLEHMLFKGTETLGTRDFEAEQPLLRQIEKTGAQLDFLKNQPDSDRQELEELRAALDGGQVGCPELAFKDEFLSISAEQGGVG